MSEYSLCFINGQSGNCNSDCEQFQDGKCDVGVEIAYEAFAYYTPDEIEELINDMYNDVELFLRRGKGEADIDLYISGLGY